MTHSDFASLVRLSDPYTALILVYALYRQMRHCFAHLTVAHVKRDNAASVPRHKTTHTRGGVYQAATLPLTDMNLKGPKVTLVENKGAYVIIFIEPEKTVKKIFFT